MKELQLQKQQLQHQLEDVTRERDIIQLENISLEKENNACKEELENLKTALTKMFSPSQITSLMQNKPVKSWEKEDIASAISLKCVSSKAYKYLREKLSFPLPSLSTLYRWMSKLNVEPGVLYPVFQLLRDRATSMDAYQRLCVLSFDETSVSKEWTYDRANDTVYSPKRYVQCAMIRGLTSAWKQLIYYNFDTDMKKDILFDIIQNVEAAGFLVVAMVSDMGPCNMRLWKDLDVSVNNTSFTNPAASDRLVYVFADAPHLLKLIRNNFLDYGFKLNEKIITSSCVREVISRSVKDLKTTFKLSSKLVNVECGTRMNVSLAAKLLSETTAKALEYFGERGLLSSTNWKDTSQFISLADEWFDVFNSKTKDRDSKKSRHAFGLYLEHQKAVVNNMINTVKAMKVCGKQYLFPFQKGMVISCKSLLALYAFLNEKFKVKYVLTYRLNQDVLEHFFGCIRQMGVSYQHPSPLQMKYRIRSFLFGKATELVGNNYNTEKRNEDVCLSEASFSGAGVKQKPENNFNEELKNELMLTAMIFSKSDTDDDTVNLEVSEIQENSFDVPFEEPTFEEVTEKEGLRYVGGFIVRKFPEYEYLGTNVPDGDKTWIGKICRNPGSLKTPSVWFFKQLEDMEKLFICFHGTNSLKPGSNSVKTLSKIICSHIPMLPADIIEYFVRCRLFFRIKVLNRENADESKKIKDKKLKFLK